MQRDNRNPALDGIRAVAILGVIYFHFVRHAHVLFGIGFGAWLTSLDSCGWLGVDVFFVLSGFLITSILLDTKHAPGYFSRFYARRALRILPLYVVFLISACGLALLLHPNDKTTFLQLVPSLTFTSNFSHQPSTGALDYLGVNWSLSVEEQYYLVWAVVVLLLSRRQLRVLCILMIITACCLRTFYAFHYWEHSIKAWRHDLEITFSATQCKMDSLAIGSLLAAQEPDRPPSVRNAWELMVAGALFVLGGCTYPPLVTIFCPLGAAGMTAGAIILCLRWPDMPVLGSGVMAWIGRRSYAMYLFHWMIWSALLPFMKSWWIVPQLATGLAATFVVSEILGVAIEQPFLRLKKHSGTFRSRVDPSFFPPL